MTILFVVLYFGAAQFGAVAEHESVETAFDLRIPFIAWSAWIYISAIPLIVMPAFAVKSDGLVRETAIGYATTLVICSAVFVVFPTTSLYLRRPIMDLDLANASDRLVWLIYTLDPPYNIFPSLHVALSAGGAMALSQVSRRLGLVGAAWASIVAISVCTTKQHFALDVAAGVAIGVCSSALAHGGAGMYARAEDGYCLAGIRAWCALTGMMYVILLVMHFGQ